MRINVRTLVAALGFCLSITTAVDAQQLQDFTGTWKVDPVKAQEKTTLLNTPPENAPEVPPHRRQATSMPLSRSG